MKLYCLGGSQSQPCFVLKFKNTAIMLDCALDLQTLLCYLPLEVQSETVKKISGTICGVKLDDELKECFGNKLFVDGQLEFAVPQLSLVDISQIDAILVSNFHTILALPYITEYSDFRGVIYATEPTLKIGQLYMEEMVEYIERCPKHNKAQKWKQQNVLNGLPAPLRDAISPTTWKTCYNKHDITSCLSKVQSVGFNEKTNIFGSLIVTPISSGYCLGSSNWTIESDYEKISYISSSSTLTTHPRPMEQECLRSSDIMILCNIRQTPLADPDVMIGEFCINAASTLRSGGNVLVPCSPSGVTYDLFECLSGHMDSMGLSSVPMYFVSPVADNSLAYSNIYAEWLSASKQSKVYLPEPPFPHAQLVDGNRLKHYPTIHDGLCRELKTPCIVFTGHPSLRMGSVLHFIQMWGASNTNTIIFTEPDYSYVEAMAPFQPLMMKVCYCPIDTSLSFHQANKLITELKPMNLIVPEQITVPPVMHPHNTDLVIKYEQAPLTYRRAEVLTLPTKRAYERVSLDPELAKTLNPTAVTDSVSVASIQAELTARDNVHVLKKLNKPYPWLKSETTEGLQPANNLWGTLDVQEFVEKLKQNGIKDVKVDNSPNGHIVQLSDDTLITIDSKSTHIYCEGSDLLRIKLRDIIVNSLPKF